MSRQARYVAFLRGINVGGKNILPMKELVEVFKRAGCENVSTYIQSGNVLFTAVAAAASESEMAIKISKSIEARFGFAVPVVLRTRDEFAAVVSANPFLAKRAEDKMLHVYFLRDTPAAADLAALDPNRSLPDAFIVQRREIYLSMPNGMARTRLTNAYFDSKLKTVSTARNWNTLLKLLQLIDTTADKS